MQHLCFSHQDPADMTAEWLEEEIQKGAGVK